MSTLFDEPAPQAAPPSPRASLRLHHDPEESKPQVVVEVHGRGTTSTQVMWLHLLYEDHWASIIDRAIDRGLSAVGCTVADL